jgi:hypothetical protein
MAIPPAVIRRSRPIISGDGSFLCVRQRWRLLLPWKVIAEETGPDGNKAIGSGRRSA